MKKQKKFRGMVTLLLALMMAFACATTTLAAENTNDVTDSVVAKITNEETGETIVLDVDDITFSRSVESNANPINSRTSWRLGTTEETIVDTYTAKFAIPSDNSKTRSSASGNKEENYVIATGTVVYTKNGEHITISRCYGGWTTTSQYIYMTDREVWLYSGIPGGSYLSKTPTSNSFDYYTSWGETLYYPGTDYSGPRLFTTATARVSGMNSYYNIELLVKI